MLRFRITFKGVVVDDRAGIGNNYEMTCWLAEELIARWPVSVPSWREHLWYEIY